MTFFFLFYFIKPKAVSDGSSFPSMNSRKAPPPVEQYDISPLLINNFIASKVSPPPARLKAEDAAIA